MRYLMLAFTEPADGRSEEFNDWYDQVHLPELLSLDGFVSAQRFVLHNKPYSAAHGTPPATYLALYELEADDPLDVMRNLNEARDVASGKLVSSTAMDAPSSRAWFYEPLGDRIGKSE